MMFGRKEMFLVHLKGHDPKVVLRKVHGSPFPVEPRMACSLWEDLFKYRVATLYPRCVLGVLPVEKAFVMS
jgi:hypothetical protein